MLVYSVLRFQRFTSAADTETDSAYSRTHCIRPVRPIRPYTIAATQLMKRSFNESSPTANTFCVF